MTIHAPDVRAHRAALRALVPTIDVFEYGKVPGLKDSEGNLNPGVTPNLYVLVTLERVVHDNGLAVRQSRRTRWRLSLRAVGKSAPANCHAAIVRLLVLENQRLEVDDLLSTPLVLESAEDATPDSGWYSALLRFAYAI